MFLIFLNHFPGPGTGGAAGTRTGMAPAELRSAMAQVLQHSLTSLADSAEAAQREMLAGDQEPEWVVQLLDLAASLRGMAISLGSEAPDGPAPQEHWRGFLLEQKDRVRSLSVTVAAFDRGPELVAALNGQLKALNRILRSGTGNPLASLRGLELLLESALPEATRQRAQPLSLVRHVLASLRVALFRPLDRGIHWPALDQIRGSLHWLWNHLGWSLPRIDGQLLERSLPADARALLRGMRESHPQAFRTVARALVSHLALARLLEGLEPAANTSITQRYAAVPRFWVVASELARLADGVFNPRSAEALPPESEAARLLEPYLRQAVLSLLQDQATIQGQLLQHLASDDVDQLASALDNLRALLLNHQRQLTGDLLGLFSPELRQRLFPDSPSLSEEGDRLRQRLYRLWLYLDPLLAKVQVQLELRDWPRLALALAQAESQVAGFRRSPEFLLIRSVDRTEFDRLAQAFNRTLDDPEDMETALAEAADRAGEMLRFLDVFLLRINARVPLIRLDLNAAREACANGRELQDGKTPAPDRPRLAHRLVQSTRTLGVRDPQSLNLLKRWVRAERGGRDARAPLEALLSHLQHLASRLDTALH
jgi:hypothetical protein